MNDYRLYIWAINYIDRKIIVDDQFIIVMKIMSFRLGKNFTGKFNVLTDKILSP